MAVYERTWRRYDGPLTPVRRRWLVITIDALKDAFKSRFFLFCYFIALLPTLFALVAVYVTHNLELLQQLGMPPEAFDAVRQWMISCLHWLFLAQAIPAFFIAVVVSPALIAADLSDNALPLYLCRPINRRDYVLGKMAVLTVLISPVTWIASLLVFVVQSLYEGGGWWHENIRIALGHLIGHITWIIVISLLSLAISAWVRFKPISRAILLGQFLILWGFSGVINLTVDTTWGALVDLRSLISVVVVSLFKPLAEVPIPPWSAWTMLTVICLLSLLLLARKVKAHEVIR
jgi:ABC-2 type transport system permease protein